MKLRCYQTSAVEAIQAEWRKYDSTLLVLATGLGKTVTFAHVIAQALGSRALVLAHREELIWQAADKIKAVTGVAPEIEMADHKANVTLFGSRVVVSSVQTQLAGERGAGRMTRFKDGFDIVVVDEGHHAVSDSYRRILEHYREVNPNVKVLGVTATPDRADELALGSVFESVAYEYGLDDAITDGWLVPVSTRAIEVQGLDYSHVRTTAGDLNGADLSKVLVEEETLHRMAEPTLAEVGQRKALVFTSSVFHAERFAEVLNRWEPGCAKWVCGKTPKDERRAILADYTARRFRILVNVGVFTEGFDDPGVEVIVMGRATKSRSLFCQMIGRGTRPLPGVVDGLESAEARRAAIAASSKPAVEIIDFVGVCGNHSLVSTADILGGDMPPELVKRANEIIQRAGRAMDTKDALAEAEREIAAERAAAEAERKRRQAELDAERERRQPVRVKAKYTARIVDPFDVLDIERPMNGWSDPTPLTEKQLNLLERAGIDPNGLDPADGRRLCNEVIARFKNGKCTFKQARILARQGYRTDVTKAEASEIIDRIFSSARERRPAMELPPSATIGGY